MCRTCCKQQIEFSGHVSFFTVYRIPAPPIIMSSIGKFLDTATGLLDYSLLWNQFCHHALVLPQQTFMLSIGPTQPTFFDVFIDYIHISYCHPFPRRTDLLAFLWPHLIFRRTPCLLTIPMGNHQCRLQVHSYRSKLLATCHVSITSENVVTNTEFSKCVRIHLSHDLGRHSWRHFEFWVIFMT